jgi:hypothetical protein
VFAICIEKYRFLVFTSRDKTNIRNENWIENANKTPLMSEVRVNNKLKLGICFKEVAQYLIFFSKASLTRESFIDIPGITQLW